MKVTAARSIVPKATPRQGLWTFPGVGPFNDGYWGLPDLFPHRDTLDTLLVQFVLTLPLLHLPAPPPARRTTTSQPPPSLDNSTPHNETVSLVVSAQARA